MTFQFRGFISFISSHSFSCIYGFMTPIFPSCILFVSLFFLLRVVFIQKRGLRCDWFFPSLLLSPALYFSVHWYFFSFVSFSISVVCLEFLLRRTVASSFVFILYITLVPFFFSFIFAFPFLLHFRVLFMVISVLGNDCFFPLICSLTSVFGCYCLIHLPVFLIFPVSSSLLIFSPFVFFSWAVS